MSEAEKVQETPKEEAPAPKDLLLKIVLPSVVSTEEKEISISSHYDESIADLRQTLSVLPTTRN